MSEAFNTHQVHGINVGREMRRVDSTRTTWHDYVHLCSLSHLKWTDANYAWNCATYYTVTQHALQVINPWPMLHQTHIQYGLASQCVCTLSQFNGVQKVEHSCLHLGLCLCSDRCVCISVDNAVVLPECSALLCPAPFCRSIHHCVLICIHFHGNARSSLLDYETAISYPQLHIRKEKKKVK